jgi:hypothetical protein
MTESEKIPLKHLAVEATAIVISILLAFAIDAWWEDRNEADLERRHLVALQAEFEQNGELLRQATEWYQESYLNAARILELIEQDPVDIDEGELERLFSGLLAGKTFHLDSGAFDGLLDAGELSLIRDEALRNRLAAWPSYVAEWSEEEGAVFSFIEEALRPHLSGRIRLRNIARPFAAFPDGESPSPILPGSGENASLIPVVTSIEFENLVYRRAQGTWHAMRDGETLRVQLIEILRLIQENLDD